jgi:UDP-3-O-[3-hydroxymyristoyl] glucosamine N-acyltransferase
MIIKELIKGYDCEIKGDINYEVKSVRNIENAVEGDLTLLIKREYLNILDKIKASVIITKQSFSRKIFEENFKGKVIIFSKNPQFLWAKILEKLHFDKTESGISETAVIGKNVIMGKNVSIGDNTVIEDNVIIGDDTIIKHNITIENNVKIGKNCLIYSNVSIRNDCIIGNRVILHPGVIIGSDGFGYAPTQSGPYKIPQIGIVRIEDDVEVGANSCIDRAAIEETIIGKGVKIDNLVQIGHNVIIGKNTIIAGNTGIAGSTKIGENCLIGGAVGIADHIKIGNNVKIAGGTGVTGSVADNKIIAGYPMMDIKAWRLAFGSLRNYPDIKRKIEKLEKELEKIKESM